MADCVNFAQGWLDNFGTKPVARHLFIAVICQGNGLGRLSEHATRWLAVQRLDPAIWRFYASWLKYGLGADIIREDFLAWLEVNYLAEGADGAMRAWRDAEGDLGPIEAFALAWLHKNRENPDAVFLTKMVSDQKTLPDQAIIDISVWAARFYESEDAIWRLWRLRDKLEWAEHSETIAAYLHASELCLGFHATKLLPTKHYLLDRLVSAQGRYFDWVEDPESACRVLYDLVREGNVYHQGATFVMQEGTHHVVPILIEHGFLDPVNDRAAIEHFADLLCRPGHNPDLMLELRRQLAGVAPHFDWQGLGRVSDSPS